MLARESSILIGNRMKSRTKTSIYRCLAASCWAINAVLVEPLEGRQQRKAFGLLVDMSINEQDVGQAGVSHVVDIASWAEQLTVELNTLNSSTAQLGATWPPPDCIIVGKVPPLTRNVDNGEYNPDYVSIGPLHRTSPKLARDDDKMRCLQAVRSAASSSTTVEVYLKELAHHEDRARSCYAERFDNMTSEMFVRMLLLDGCYILNRFSNVQPPATNGATTANGIVPPVSAARHRDMCDDLAMVRDIFYLAENQIPFFVLEEIVRLSTLDGNTRVVNGVRQYAIDLLDMQKYAVPVAAPAMVAPEPTALSTGPGNLLHLLHMHLQPTAPPSAMASGQRDGESVGRWRTATDYYFAGVKFKSRAFSENGNVCRCILDVNLDSGTLEVPCLNIDNETWRLLRNLMELERRNPEEVSSHVTAYCFFMSQIACTEKDVELLSRRGVIVHGLGNHGEVAKCFANLCRGILFDLDDPGFNYLRATCQVLEKRFQSYPRRWMAWLRRKYFSNPWLAVGLLAAAVGLICGVIQAVYSVLSYKK